MQTRSIVLPLLIATATLALAQEPSSSGDTGSGAATNNSDTGPANNNSGTTPSPSTPGSGRSSTGPSAPGSTPGSTPGSAPGSTPAGGTTNPYSPGGSPLWPPVRPNGINGIDQSVDQGFNMGGRTGIKPDAAQNPTAETPKTGSESEAPKFTLPGGYGAAPQTITPGEGLYARPPISFSSTFQQGYNDNIFYSSGKNYPDTVISGTTVVVSNGPFSYEQKIPKQVISGTTTNPIHGSFVTQGSVGTQILLSASRLVLSAELNAGGTYYWDRLGMNPIDPTGSGNVVFVFKALPRVQLSGMFSSTYQTQPNFTAVNAPTQSGMGDYISSSGRLTLGYQFSGRISTESTMNVLSSYYLKSLSQANNYIDTTFGQALRYALSPRITAVGEFRYTTTTYQGSDRNSDTDTLLGGFDYQFSRRFQGSLRAGESIRQYQVANAVNPNSPFLEATFNYGYGAASTIQWLTRYGFEEGAAAASTSQQVFRTSLSVNHVFSYKLSGGLSVSYSNSAETYLTGAAGLKQDTVTATLSGQYVLSRSITLFGNFMRTQVFSTPVQTYSVDTVFLGASYHF